MSDDICDYNDMSIEEVRDLNEERAAKRARVTDPGGTLRDAIEIDKKQRKE